mmetsp:Transcript_13119/g.20006  ORF Transcript_13119/g.20006 Transcript_13119/m.20006 type:complete len:430 (-) Transcript_13119:71-1360(-)
MKQHVNRRAVFIVVILFCVVMSVKHTFEFNLEDILKSISPNETPIKMASLSDSKDDGCGLVNNTETQVWKDLSKTEIEEMNQVQTCIKNRVRQNDSFLDERSKDIVRKYTAISDTSVNTMKGLQCNEEIALRRIQATLGSYGQVWMFGDSILGQLYYTLSCALNSSIANYGASSYTGHESFSYSSTEQGTTTDFIYSKVLFLQEESEANLYQSTFPDVIQNLTSNDMILVLNSAHYSERNAARLDKSIRFIAKQSIRTNASVFFMEPTPEEWPTSNGRHTWSCVRNNCQCESLTSARLKGRGNHSITPEQKTKDDWVQPDLKFFDRLYPSLTGEHNTNHLHPALAWETRKNSRVDQSCLPNCIPATWRSDHIRLVLKEIPNRVHLVPIFWQLVSKKNPTHRGVADCTHRSLDATMLMMQQWIRTIERKI